MSIPFLLNSIRESFYFSFQSLLILLVALSERLVVPVQYQTEVV